jgi:arylsulfatase
VEHPGTQYQGRAVAPLQGRSLVPLLAGADAVHPADHVMGWELFGKRALRKGDWKIVWAPPPEGKGTWELFDTAADPSELHDRAATEPQRLAELIALWDGYARDNGVILPDRTSGY